MDQIFLTVRDAVQDSFMASLGVASVFGHVVLRPGLGIGHVPPTSGFFFGVNLDYGALCMFSYF